MGRKVKDRRRFERRDGRLIDRTQPGHTTIIHDSPSADPTSEVTRRIEAGDFRELAPLLSVADVRRVRPVLLKKAELASRLEPNLAQGLALMGGAQEVRILRRHLGQARGQSFAALSEEQQQEAIYVAHSLLSIRTSPLAASVIANAVRCGSARTKQSAARFVSTHLIAGSSLSVERIFFRVLPTLLTSTDQEFVSAFPILLQRHYAKARERGMQLIRDGDASLRRRLATTLTTMPYYGLELLLDAYRHESNLDLRLTIAAAIVAALPKSQVAKLAREALSDRSPAIRLRGAELLEHVDVRLAQELSRRRDPDPAIEAVLRPYRIRSR